jgi:phosphoribosylformylglycinamidine synthase PurS subunit
VKALVYVTYKQGVLDPQGKAVRGGLGSLGYKEVADVRQGKYFEIQLEEKDPARAKARVEEMCKRLLANPVMENFRIEIQG